MTLHSLVLSSDSFSCNCNSIQSPVSIVHLRVILTYLIPLLRVYINYSISNAYSVQLRVQYSTVQQCIQISTRINSSSVHTYIFVCFIRNSLRVILQGFVDPIMQHGVRIEAVFASLQQGEHMVESTGFQSSRQVQ